MKRWFAAIASLAVAAAVLSAPGVAASERDDGGPLAAVKRATAKFHNLDKATDAGYGKLLNCFDLPGVGGMGQHYVNGSLLDAKLEPTKPEALVYEVDGEKLRLVAVEYIVPFPAWDSSTPPRLFDHWFFRNDTLQLWALHAWIWRSNPLGTFANYNPNVKLCPGR